MTKQPPIILLNHIKIFAELGKILTKITKEFYICHNYGINGETSSDLLRRSWNILKSHKEAKICLLLIGTNDTKIPTPLEVYKDNLRQIISSIKANGKTPIIGTLPDLQFSPYYMFNREYIDQYNNVIRDLAKEHNVILCELKGLAEYLIDGVHFTHEGYNKVAEKWAKTILSLS